MPARKPAWPPRKACLERPLHVRPCGIIRPYAMAQPGEPPLGDISQLLRAWSDGDQSALARLTPIVYDELRRLARRYMKRERPGHSLQTTALVNEAYMRLVDYERMH